MSARTGVKELGLSSRSQTLELSMPPRSEDFGHYLHRCRGAFFGVGAGEDHPQIHTEHYEYPDTLLEPTVEAFRALLTSE